MIYTKYFCLPLLAACAMPAWAETVLVDEDFDNDYTKTINYFFDADGQTPHKSIASIFTSQEQGGVCMPWWITKDFKESKDRFMASHSYYQEPGTSNDWLITEPIEIPSEGFVLSFDAQSLIVRDDAVRLSDLSIFITEDIINPDALPTEPTAVFSQIPFGEKPDICQDDWIRYSMPLDAYAGKSIRINFVNQNTDSDILCLDNVKVARTDVASVWADPLPEYISGESMTVCAYVSPLVDTGVGEWSVNLNAAQNGEKKLLNTWTGANIAAGDTVKMEFEMPIAKGESYDLDFEFSCQEQQWKQIAPLNTTCMHFSPVHRVFAEETTSLHCGNCPMGIYTFESIFEDSELGPYFVPVSVHIAALGADPMALPAYYNNLSNSNAAPIVYIDRSSEEQGFIPAFDMEYDPSNPDSFAHMIASKIAEPTFVDIDVAGDWVIEGTDTVAINCMASVRPAIDLKDTDYRIAYILTENNVGMDKNTYWVQENYLSGIDVPGNAGGWTLLGKFVPNLRYHDVARAISDFEGHEGSVPAYMQAESTYTHTFRMNIPDTYKEGMSDAIRRQFCDITAILIDNATGRVINCARHSMSPTPYHRFNASDLAGVSSIDADDATAVSTEYFDLQGRRVSSPSAGVYIQRLTFSDGSKKSNKIIVSK